MFSFLLVRGFTCVPMNSAGPPLMSTDKCGCHICMMYFHYMEMQIMLTIGNMLIGWGAGWCVESWTFLFACGFHRLGGDEEVVKQTADHNAVVGSCYTGLTSMSLKIRAYELFLATTISIHRVGRGLIAPTPFSVQDPPGPLWQMTIFPLFGDLWQTRSQQFMWQSFP